MGLGVLAALAALRVLMCGLGDGDAKAIRSPVDLIHLESVVRPIKVSTFSSMLNNKKRLVGKPAAVVSGQGIVNPYDDAWVRTLASIPVQVRIARESLASVDKIRPTHSQTVLMVIGLARKHDVTSQGARTEVGVSRALAHVLMSIACRAKHLACPDHSNGGSLSDIFTGDRQIKNNLVLVFVKNQRTDVIDGKLKPRAISIDDGLASGFHALLGDLELLPELRRSFCCISLGGFQRTVGGVGASLGLSPSAPGIYDGGAKAQKTNDVQPELLSGKVGGILGSDRRADISSQLLAIAVAGVLAPIIGGLFGYLAARADGLYRRPDEGNSSGHRHSGDGADD